MKSLFPQFFSAFLLFVVLTSTPYTEAQTKFWCKVFESRGLCVGINPLNRNTLYSESASGISVSHDKGKSWGLLKSQPPISNLREILVLPDTSTILVGGDGNSNALYRTSDGGRTWLNVLPGYGMDGESIVYDHLHPDTVFAGKLTNAAIFRSLDAGAHWDSLSRVTDTTLAVRELCGLAIRPNMSNVLYAGAGGSQIAKSVDYGVHWTVVSDDHTDEIPKIVFDPLHPDTAYATVFGDDALACLRKTTDGGDNWFKTSLQGHNVWSLDIDAQHPEILYVGLFGTSIFGVERTIDGGSTFENLTTGLDPSFSAWNIKVHPMAGDDIWVAGTGSAPVNGLFQAKNPADADLTIEGNVFNDQNGDGLFNQNDVGLQSWIVHLSGAANQTTTTDANGRFEFNGLPQGTFVVTEESQAGWTELQPTTCDASQSVTTPLCGRVLSIDFANQRFGPGASFFAETFGSIAFPPCGWKVEDKDGFGGSWRHDNLLFHTPPYDAFNPTSGRPSSDDWLITSGVNLQPEKLYDLSWWERTNIAAANGIESLAVAIGTSQTNSALNRVIYNSTGFNTNTAFVPVEVDFMVPAEAQYYVGFRDYSGRSSRLRLDDIILRYLQDYMHVDFKPGSCDNVFNPHSRGMVQVAILGTALHDVTHIDPASVTIGGGFPVSFNVQDIETAPNDTNSCPVAVADGFNDLILKFKSEDVAKAVGNANAGDNVRLTFTGKLVDGTPFEGTDVVHVVGGRPATAPQTITETTKPKEFALSESYPNPFNPTTTIRYQLPADSKVTLKIYNTLGQVVATLVDGIQEAGYKSVVWDASKNSSDVYFYRLDAVSVTDGGKGFTQVRKMLLVK